MTFVLIAAVVLTSVAGDILVSHGMKQVGEVQFRPTVFLGAFGRALRGGWMPAGVLAMIASFFSLLAALSAADASLVVPATASSYALNTLGARLFLKERVSGTRWAGALLVTAGVSLLSF